MIPSGQAARSAFALAAVLALALGCRADDPFVDRDEGEGPDAGPPFADAVLAFLENDVPVSCSETLPVCGGQTASCGPVEVLGPPDGVAYSLPPGGVVEVGLLCSLALETGGEPMSPDLKLWATFGEGARAVVEVSYDDIAWYTLADVTTNDPGLDLSRTGEPAVRFIRVASVGTGPIALDAIEGLRAPGQAGE